MKVVFEGQSNLSADQEGEYYFYHGDTTWYLNDFMAVRNPKDNFGYQAATHISNTGRGTCLRRHPPIQGTREGKRGTIPHSPLRAP